jgi:hypothetical protein
VAEPEHTRAVANGHGRIAAATGDYAERRGTFVETAEMREFTPTGKMDFTMELRLALEPSMDPNSTSAP